MYRYKAIILTLLLSLILGCAVSKHTNEDFDDFFLEFNTSQKFQESRIVFPLTYTNKGINQETSENLVYKSEWVFINLKSDKYNTKKFKTYFVSKSGLFSKPNSYSYYIKAVDNSINLEYIFVPDESGYWYLIEIIDRSE